MDDYPNIPVVALDQIARLQEENARLIAALEPIREAWKTYRILEDSSESICWTQHCAIKRCMEILNETIPPKQEEADRKEVV